MLRKFLAIVCGSMAGLMLVTSITAGLEYRFPEEAASPGWSVFTWGEHWFFRALVSLICSACAGFITGLVAREKGRILACLAVLPSWLAWVAFVSVSLLGYLPFGDYITIHVSIGNKVFGGIIILLTFPVAWFFGRYGQNIVRPYSEHFDKRKHSLLGVKWYHFIWIPILLNLIIIQASWAGFYFLQWFIILLKTQRHEPFSILPIIVPGLFSLAMFFTLKIMYTGVKNTFLLLAGYTEVVSRKSTLYLVLKYMVVYQVVAAILQFLIEFIPFGIRMIFS